MAKNNSIHIDTQKPILASIVIGIAFSLPYVLSHLRDAVAPQIVVSIQLLAVGYLAGFWTLPRIPAYLAIVYAAQVQAVFVVWSRIGTYVKGEQRHSKYKIKEADS